ncbi:MAG TPA: hypothetical protein VGP72_28115 [Planctomycetota bacterium]|jgi:hypothetical protein
MARRILQFRLVQLALLIFTWMSGIAFAGETVAQPRADAVSVSISPNPARPGEAITLTATGNVPATYSWSMPYATPNSSTDNPATCAFASCGGQKISLYANGTIVGGYTVVVTDTVMDVDGDGVPTDLETALGTDPSDVSSLPTVPPKDNKGYLSVWFPIKLRMNNSKIGQDTLSIDLLIDAKERKFSTSTQKAALYFGGIVKTFTVTPVGKKFVATPDSKSKNDKMSIKIDISRFADIKIRLTRGSFYETLSRNNSGLATANRVTIPLFAVLGDQLFADQETIRLSTKNGVLTGTASAGDSSIGGR